MTSTAYRRPVTIATTEGGSGTFILRPGSLGAPRTDEALIRMVGCGICHTDIAFASAPSPAGIRQVLGHEGAGVVQSVGADVIGLVAGDHVVLTFLSCGACAGCSEKGEARCEHFMSLNFGGARPDGSHALKERRGGLRDRFFGQSAFASFAIANQRNIVKVPSSAPLELLGPFGCSVQTGAGAIINSLAVGAGCSVVIFGAGAVGLSAVMAAKLMKASPIIVVDRLLNRLELARTLGATHTLDAGNGDVLQAIRQIAIEGVSRSLDTTGNPEVMRQAIDVLGFGGVCGLVAVAPHSPLITIDAGDMLTKYKTVRGIVEGDSRPQTFIPWLIQQYENGCFPIEKLVTFYPFSEIAKATQDSREGRCIKPILLFDDPIKKVRQNPV